LQHIPQPTFSSKPIQFLNFGLFVVGTLNPPFVTGYPNSSVPVHLSFGWLVAIARKKPKKYAGLTWRSYETFILDDHIFYIPITVFRYRLIKAPFTRPLSTGFFFQAVTQLLLQKFSVKKIVFKPLSKGLTRCRYRSSCCSIFGGKIIMKVKIVKIFHQTSLTISPIFSA